MDTPVTQGHITDLYKTILDQENSHNTLFITILLGIVVILLGITFWWNKKGAERYIREKVKLETDIQNIKIEKIKAEVSFLINAAVEEKLKLELKKYEERILKIEAEVYRTLSITLTSNKQYSHSLIYYSITIRKIQRLKFDSDIYKFTIAILEVIQIMKTNNQNKVHGLNIVKENIKKLPDALFDKRKEIIDFLDTCENVE